MMLDKLVKYIVYHLESMAKMTGLSLLKNYTFLITVLLKRIAARNNVDSTGIVT